MEGLAGIILLGVFLFLLGLGMPIAISIAVSSIATLLLYIPFDVAVFSAAQKMVSGINSFSLVAIPLFVLSGVLMNKAGIATRLINLAMLALGKLPGGLAVVNVAANALFGSMSSSAIAASTAIGGIMIPQEVENGYDREYAGAVNIASAPTGMVIPPSTGFIMYATIAGASVNQLFLGGYLVGALWGLAIAVVAVYLAKKRKYPFVERDKTKSIGTTIIEGIPSLFLIVIIVVGIMTGWFTAIEASGIAVAYSLLLGVIYKTISLKDIPEILKDTTISTGAIMFLLATSTMMSFALSFAGIPQAIVSGVLTLTESPLLILLIINLLLLLMGMFMDVGPAILISTPILLPVALQIGIDPVHYGLFSIMNLSVGSITPPVGSGLYVGSDVAKVKPEVMIKHLLPFFGAIVVVLLIIIYFPEIVMWLPNLS